MSANSQDQTEQGWYKDPNGEADERFYTGEGWLNWTRRTSAIDGNEILSVLKSIKTFVAVGSVAIVVSIWLTRIL